MLPSEALLVASEYLCQLLDLKFRVGCVMQATAVLVTVFPEETAHHAQF